MQRPSRSRRLALRSLFAVALVVVAARSVAAQSLTSTIQPTDVPIAAPADLLDVPDVARSADGSHLVVWEESNGVYLRTFDAAGNALAPRTVAALQAGRVFGRARAAALPDGNYVVAWVQTTASTHLYAALFDRLGTPLGVVNDLGLVDAVPGSASYTDSPRPAALAVDDAGVIAVAWTQGGHIRLDRFVTTVAAAGGALAQISSSDLGAGYGPSLAAWPGGFVLAWMRSPDRYWVDPSRIVVRWLGRDGVPRGEEHTADFFSLFSPLSPAAAQSIDPVAVTVDPSGRAVVVWHDRVWPSPIERLRAQRFAADGTPLGAPLDLVTVNRPEAHYFAFVLSDVAARPDGAFLVAVTEVRSQGFCAAPPGPIFPEPPWPWCSLTGGKLDAVVRGYRADGTFLAEIALGATAAPELTGGVVPTTDGWLAALEGPTFGVARVAPAPPCGGEALCLGGRFRVEAEWRTAAAAGTAHPLDVTGGTGAFWFFAPTNVELLVKVLDGRGVNGKFWFFYASLSDVEFDLVVTDTTTGAVKRYHNPQGTLASRADVDAFEGADEPATPAFALAAGASVFGEAAASVVGTEGCGATTLCLQDGRFVVSARWRVPDGGEGVATPLPWTGDTGAFWFFVEHNLELLVKVLDGRGVNGHFWVFFASTSDVEFDLEVLDTATGQRRTYHNVQGTMASRADVDAF